MRRVMNTSFYISREKASIKLKKERSNGEVIKAYLLKDVLD